MLIYLGFDISPVYKTTLLDFACTFFLDKYLRQRETSSKFLEEMTEVARYLVSKNQLDAYFANYPQLKRSFELTQAHRDLVSFTGSFYTFVDYVKKHLN